MPAYELTAARTGRLAPILCRASLPVLPNGGHVSATMWTQRKSAPHSSKPWDPMPARNREGLGVGRPRIVAYRFDRLVLGSHIPPCDAQPHSYADPRAHWQSSFPSTGSCLGTGKLPDAAKSRRPSVGMVWRFVGGRTFRYPALIPISLFAALPVDRKGICQSLSPEPVHRSHRPPPPFPPLPVRV